METKRTKLWRKKHKFRVFKARMIYYASFYPNPRNDKGLPLPNLHWFELAKTDWAHIYRTTGTPCSCIVCRRAKYSRLEYKRDTARIIRETEE